MHEPLNEKKYARIDKIETSKKFTPKLPEQIRHKAISYEANVKAICDREADSNKEVVRLNNDLKQALNNLS